MEKVRAKLALFFVETRTQVSVSWRVLCRPRKRENPGNEVKRECASNLTSFLSVLLSCHYTLKLLAETCVQRRCETRYEVVLHGGTLVFSPLRPLRAVAQVESRSTFRETCLATEVRKSSAKPTLLHGTTPAETCFATPLYTSFG